LKELLGDIAIYNRGGPYKNTYELRPEYKSQTGKNSAMTMASMNPVFLSADNFQAEEERLLAETSSLPDEDMGDGEDFEEA
jgi:hypothetical protein